MSKTKHFRRTALVLLLSVSGIGLVSCGTDDQSDTSSHHAAATAKHDDDDSDAETKPPHVGMTQAQVRAKYGDPDSVNMTSKGEMWSYDFHHNMLLKSAIPGYGFSDMFNKGHRLFIKFDENGKVKSYSSVSTKSAAERMTD